MLASRLFLDGRYSFGRALNAAYGAPKFLVMKYQGVTQREIGKLICGVVGVEVEASLSFV